MSIIFLDKEGPKCFLVQVRLKNLKALVLLIDDNPPYARDICWTEEFQESLLMSIQMGIPIGLIRLVAKKEKQLGFWLLEGKQRFDAILDMLDSIPDDIQYAYSLDVVIIEQMEMDEQAEWFCILNR